jgi:hypothetical protein
MEDLDINKLLYDVSQGHSVTLPSGAVATIREMTGHDQRKFLNKTSLSNGSAINDLLGNCIDTIDELALNDDPKVRTTQILDMLAGDRHCLLFSIRRFSLGDDFNFTMECPQCKKRETWEVNLKDEAFEMTPYPFGREKVLEYKSEVRPGLVVKIKFLDGHGEMAALRKANALDLLTDLEVRIPQYKDDKGNWVGIKLNQVPDRIIAELRKQLRSAEGRLDSRVTIICKACGDPATFDLLQVPDFMIPNVTY